MPLIHGVSLRSNVRSLYFMIATVFTFACRCKWKATASMYDEILPVRWYNFTSGLSRGVTVPTVNRFPVFDKEPPSPDAGSAVQLPQCRRLELLI